MQSSGTSLDCKAHLPLSSSRQAARTLPHLNPPLYVNFTIPLSAAFLGAGIAWLYLQGRQAALRERLRAREEETARLTAELAAARTEAGRLTALHAQVEAQLSAATDAHERLRTEFQSLSAEALSRNNTAFLDLARESFAKLHAHSSGDLEKRQQAIEAMVRPLKESLVQVDAKIGALENARKEAYGSLTEQLKGLASTQASLQSETTKLSRSLRSTSTAGRWGEIQLQRVVELSGMLENVDFIQQEAAGDVRPDMLVRLPGGKSIAVDAKAPMQAYLEALEAPDEALRKAKFAEHARAVRNHIDALGAKSYWKNIQPAPEFVVLFIPGEAFYAAALRHEPDLFERGTGVGVILASPATLMALLKAAAYGWKQESLSRNAEEIRHLGVELHKRVAAVAENLDQLGQRLEQAVVAYNSTVYQTESQVLVTGRKLEKLGAGSEKKLGEPRRVDEVPRPLRAPELKP
jgi:DNA recombination protein RmuC